MKTSVTVFEARSLAPQKTLTIHLEGRGAGSLLLKGGAKATTAFFRVRTGDGDSLLKIGKISKKESKQGTSTADSLAEIMREARRLFDLASTVPNLKEYIENEKLTLALDLEAKRSQMAELAKKKKIEDARGTFVELFKSYIDNVDCSESTKEEYRRALRKDIEENNPELASKKARDIKAEDIIVILSQIYNRGSHGMADKMRAYLHAAYQFEIDRTHSYKKKIKSEGLTFELESNPVSAIPKQFQVRPIDRALTNEEMAAFFNTICITQGVSQRMGLLFKLNIQAGGQRILQLARAKWSDYDLVKKRIYLIDRKGKRKKGASERGRVHIVPLTDSAMKIVEELMSVSEGFEYPFSEDGKKPYLVSSFSHATGKWLESENAVLHGKEIPHFTPRDIRRTCTQMMKRIGVVQSDSDALQSHGMTGTVMDHYLNNPELFTADKLSALKKYERELKKIISKAAKAKEKSKS